MAIFRTVSTVEWAFLAAAQLPLCDIPYPDFDLDENEQIWMSFDPVVIADGTSWTVVWPISEDADELLF